MPVIRADTSTVSRSMAESPRNTLRQWTRHHQAAQGLHIINSSDAGGVHRPHSNGERPSLGRQAAADSRSLSRQCLIPVRIGRSCANQALKLTIALGPSRATVVPEPMAAYSTLALLKRTKSAWNRRWYTGSAFGSLDDTHSDRTTSDDPAGRNFRKVTWPRADSLCETLSKKGVRQAGRSSLQIVGTVNVGLVLDTQAGRPHKPICGPDGGCLIRAHSLDRGRSAKRSAATPERSTSCRVPRRSGPAAIFFARAQVELGPRETPPLRRGLSRPGLDSAQDALLTGDAGPQTIGGDEVHAIGEAQADGDSPSPRPTRPTGPAGLIRGSRLTLRSRSDSDHRRTPPRPDGHGRSSRNSYATPDSKTPSDRECPSSVPTKHGQ